MRLLRIILPAVLGFAALTVIAASFQATAEAAADPDLLLVPYPVPGASHGDPLHVAVESPGRIWFTMPYSNAIGSLVVTSTTDYAFAFYPSPTPDSQPFDLAYDGDREVIWFTERKSGRIGRLDIVAGTVADQLITNTANISVTGIAVAHNGDVWFTEHDGNRIGRLDPESNAIQEFLYGTLNALPEHIAIDANGIVWFTVPGQNGVVSFDPATQIFEYEPVNTPAPPESFPPGDITIGAGGFPWVTAPDKDWIGVFFPGTLTLWRWRAIPTMGGRPLYLDSSSLGGFNYIWYVEESSGRVGQYVIDSQFRTVRNWDHPLVPGSSQLGGIAADSAGHAWIAERSGGLIVEWRPPYLYRTALPTILLN